MNAAGLAAVEATSQKVADLVDDLLGKRWDRHAGKFVMELPVVQPAEPVEATCACGSGIPVQKMLINGQTVTLIALPLIFQQFREVGKAPSERTLRELLETVKIYNPVPAAEEEAYAAAVAREYAAFCEKEKATA